MPSPPSSSTPRRAVREVDVEVVTEEEEARRTSRPPEDPLAAFLARLMDSLFTIPGTQIRLGLDPLLGLIPIIGAPASALVSLTLLARGARQGVPNFILARMALNVIANAVLDELPVVGDFLSIFFRSNKINYELIQKYAGTKRVHSRTDRLFVWALLSGVTLVVICAVLGLATLAYLFLHWAVH